MKVNKRLREYLKKTNQYAAMLDVYNKKCIDFHEKLLKVTNSEIEETEEVLTAEDFYKKFQCLSDIVITEKEINKENNQLWANYYYLDNFRLHILKDYRDVRKEKLKTKTGKVCKHWKK